MGILQRVWRLVSGVWCRCTIAWAFGICLLPAAEPLRICATVPDLGDLARAVGGEDVTVTVFARGGDDPHFVEPRPGFAKALSKADLVLSIGLELEVGWLPVVITQSRNPALAVGRPGHCEAAAAVRPLGVPTGVIDRSHGDVHGAGNPHFLTDPACGVQVARLIADRIGTLRPDLAVAASVRWRTFALDVASRLLGAAVVRRAGDEAVVAALLADRLDPLIGDGADLGGWLGRLKNHKGTRLVADHDLWPYVARRFGLTVIAFLEPRPGVPPTTAHLTAVVDRARREGARAIITAPYVDARHVQVVAGPTGLPVVPLAHQVGSLPDAGDWLALIERNVAALAAALEGR